ncbi:MAG: peroxide stress protein YaaA, partial [Cutibacterium granulosum]|nr:peroxide stress protein YaaA [Cutibacterium granulosum]
GRWRVISFTAKTARGLMAGWLVRNRVRIPGALKNFDVGWRYHVEGSTPEVPVFRKEE